MEPQDEEGVEGRETEGDEEEEMDREGLFWSEGAGDISSSVSSIGVQESSALLY